jgi:hypothetical protein
LKTQSKDKDFNKLFHFVQKRFKISSMTLRLKRFRTKLKTF